MSFLKFCSLVVSLVLIGLPLTANSTINHQMKIVLTPQTHHIAVTNKVTLTEQTSNKLFFFLHGDLVVKALDAKLSFVDKVTDSVIPLKKYEVQLKEGQRQFSLSYSGRIYHPVEQLSEGFAQSFTETPGLIGEEGVYLAQSSFWYPVIEDELITFSMEVQMPAPWKAVSQGDRIKYVADSSTTTTIWQEEMPQESLYLTAAPYTVYEQTIGTVTALAYLFQADAELAQQYLDATAQYIALYDQLIGPYPYSKFALVENFWETGYGMPSFTLLGSSVLRLPFIIFTSYPHEILHNWWGNGVYVDYKTGNWAEGLTAYLSDHLMKEQRGQGAQHRRQILQHYADFVDGNQDFPLTAFTSRHSSVTEAVGYGKTQLFFHMLRKRFGDETFTKVLQHFYQTHRAKHASFDDWRRAFEDVTKVDLTDFFNQWVKRTGSPQLQLVSAISRFKDAQFELTLDIQQIQNESPYTLTIPVAVTLQGKETAIIKNIPVNQKQQEVSIHFAERPLSISIDPEFDLFRRVDLNEIPPALSQAFGADKALLVLPSKAKESLLKAYRQLAESWKQTQSSGIDIQLDSKLTDLPIDRAVWIFGQQNLYFNVVQDAAKSFEKTLSENNIKLTQADLNNDARSIVVAIRNKQNLKHAIAFVSSDNVNALPGLARKLPHYRKYSYLAFEGDAPTNIVKGQFTVSTSPLKQIVKQQDGRRIEARFAPLEATVPLVSLPH